MTPQAQVLELLRTSEQPHIGVRWSETALRRYIGVRFSPDP
jgi:hypothetical protein